jgi:hypothetical protein
MGYKSALKGLNKYYLTLSKLKIKNKENKKEKKKR